jgi:hypothetical protein
VTSLTTPAAIVVGFGLLGTFTGLGLYFGLRSRAGALVVSSPAIATIDDGATSRVAGSTAGRIAPGTASFAAPSSVATDTARHAIEAQHEHLVEACWNPSFARRPAPAQVNLTITLDYAEDGRLAVHSLQQDMMRARADVTMCVDKELVLPVVSPPGRRVRVVVPIVLP